MSAPAVSEVAAALAALTGEPHPLAMPGGWSRVTAVAHFADAWPAGPVAWAASGADRRTAAADRSAAIPVRAGTVRSWPLLVLAAPAAAEVCSGWVGIAQKTGFGLVSPLPGIWPSLHLDTAITLPVGVTER